MKDLSKLSVHPITLRFHQTQQHLEKEYRTFSFNKYLRHIRLCHWIALFFYAIYIFVDLHIAAESATVFFTIRFAIVCPLFVVGIGLSYLPWYRRICYHMLSFYVLLTAGGFMAMGFFAPPELHFVYFLSVLGCLIFGYIFIHLPLLFAAITGWTILGAYCLIQSQWGNQTENALFSYISCLFGFNLLLTIICYMEERADREYFYLSHLLIIEQNKTHEMNANLKDIVEKRTIELQQLAEAMKRIKKLSGLLPICTACKKVRDDKGYWNQIESYISNHSEANFSHSLCPECAKALYPELNLDNSINIED